MNIFRWIKCNWTSLCGFKANSDDTGVWGECTDCGKRVGFIDRKTLRSYCDNDPGVKKLNETYAEKCNRIGL